MRLIFRQPSFLSESHVNERAIPILAGAHWVDKAASVGLSGAAPKVFLRLVDGRSYIAKRPTKKHVGARECVTEHLIARLGNILPVRFARTRLARLQLPAAHGVHFLSEFFLEKGRDHLLHGVEAFALALETNRDAFEVVRTENREQEFYTLAMVRDVLLEVARPLQTGDFLIAAFARMIAFDALLGIQDRHAQNWGLIHEARSGNRVFAPLFDSARGLFLRRSDAELAQHLGSASYIRRYAARSRPLFGTGQGEPCDHFDLFKSMLETYSPLASASAVRLVDAASDERVRLLLRREFDQFLSPTRLEMIAQLIQYRRSVLQSIVQTSK